MRSRLTWLAIVAPLWLVLVLCCAWEPIVRDSWGHFHEHHYRDMSLDFVVDFAKGQYVHNNPRFGQVLTFLLMTPGPWHALVTPIAELAMFLVITVLVLGRWPQLASAADARAFLIVTGVVASCSPAIGQMLFYAPFTGNYTLSFAINLAWLVPYRLAGEAARPQTSGLRFRAVLASLGMLVLGAVAGECNEHTPPAVVMLALAFAWPAIRAARQPRAWMVAGAIGLAAGWIALLYAPGQHIRYGGLADDASTLGRIAARGAARDAFLVVKPYAYLAVAVPWLAALGFARWRDRQLAVVMTPATRLALAALGIASLVVALTLLGSPKEGERLYFAAVVFAAMAIAGVLLAAARSRALHLALAAISAVALAYIAVRCVDTYRVVGAESAARVDILMSAAPGSTPTVTRYSRDKTRWFIGEDFGSDSEDHRKLIARDFGLADIDLEP